MIPDGYTILAVDTDTNDEVYCFTCIKKETYICIICKLSLQLNKGCILRPYFKHINGTNWQHLHEPKRDKCQSKIKDKKMYINMLTYLIMNFSVCIENKCCRCNAYNNRIIIPQDEHCIKIVNNELYLVYSDKITYKICIYDSVVNHDYIYESKICIDSDDIEVKYTSKDTEFVFTNKIKISCDLCLNLVSQISSEMRRFNSNKIRISSLNIPYINSQNRGLITNYYQEIDGIKVMSEILAGNDDKPGKSGKLQDYPYISDIRTGIRKDIRNFFELLLNNNVSFKVRGGDKNTSKLDIDKYDIHKYDIHKYDPDTVKCVYVRIFINNSNIYIDYFWDNKKKKAFIWFFGGNCYELDGLYSTFTEQLLYLVIQDKRYYINQRIDQINRRTRGRYSKYFIFDQKNNNIISLFTVIWSQL